MEKNNNYNKILVLGLIILVFYLVTKNNYETFGINNLIGFITNKYPSNLIPNSTPNSTPNSKPNSAPNSTPNSAPNSTPNL